MRTITLALMVAALAMATPAWADMVTVDGNSTVYFAGQTAGDMPLTASSGDSATFHGDGSLAITLPPYVDVTGFGGTIDITAVGRWGFGPSNVEGPSGGTWGTGTSHAEYDDLGISLLTAPFNGLAGVFLTNSAPSTPAPASLSTLSADDMTTPLLQQSFYIGSSLSGVTVPAGATRLFFGLHNGYGWYNNVGSVDVTVVPVPAAVVLGGIGLGLVGLVKRRRK